MPDPAILLLTKLQYCHVIDNNTGVVRLVEGPFRGPLESNESLYGAIRDKFIVKEGQYAVILNPFDAKSGDVRHGDREVRVGPTIFSLFPGEVLDQGVIKDQYDLVKGEGLLVKALQEFEDDKIYRNAGDRWVVIGPASYIPQKYALVEQTVRAISLGKDAGVYVKNVRSGEIRLEKGPQELMLDAEEELWEKEYTERELDALRLENEDFDRTHAIPLSLLKGEAALIMAGSSQHVEFGPQIILLEPFEKPYIMEISGKTPKIPNQLKIWKVLLGPVFSTD